mmetsp:Transcript_25573/g.61490  ORF Transcript_25573/g.61490 Transcript_25573/m.61490 type:complete len:214 (-) Transcript_25573:243-884(-)
MFILALERVPQHVVAKLPELPLPRVVAQTPVILLPPVTPLLAIVRVHGHSHDEVLETRRLDGGAVEHIEGVVPVDEPWCHVVEPIAVLPHVSIPRADSPQTGIFVNEIPMEVAGPPDGVRNAVPKEVEVGPILQSEALQCNVDWEQNVRQQVTEVFGVVLVVQDGRAGNVAARGIPGVQVAHGNWDRREDNALVAIMRADSEGERSVALFHPL